MKAGESIAARRRIGPIRAEDIAGDPVEGEDFSGTGEAEISINGADWIACRGTFAEIGDGFYYYEAHPNEVSNRGLVVVKLDEVCEQSTFLENVDTNPQGIPVNATSVDDLHVGQLYAQDDVGDAVLGEDFAGAGELEVSINGAAWAAASGSIVEIGDGWYDYIPDPSECTEVGWLAAKISGVCQECVVRATIVDAPGGSAQVSTAAAIRDRIYSILESSTPTTLVRDKFRRYRNEYGADFRASAEAHPTGTFRRFQVRRVGDDLPPDVSNVTEERVRVTFEIVVAYPQDHRYGPDNAMDRDDVAFEDWLAINALIGIYGRAQFTGSYDCTPLGATMTREEGDACDFLVVEAEFEYVRSTQ